MSDLTLRALHTAMLADLTEAYGDRVATLALYDPFVMGAEQDPQPLPTPALLLELEAIDPEPEDGTERQTLRLVWVAHCILSLRTEAIQMELRVFAADLMDHLRFRRWGYPGAIQSPEAISAQPGEFQPGLAGFDSYLVRWEQVVHLGVDRWAGVAGAIPPYRVFLGDTPDIGADHEDRYWQLDTGQELNPSMGAAALQGYPPTVTTTQEEGGEP